MKFNRQNMHIEYKGEMYTRVFDKWTDERVISMDKHGRPTPNDYTALGNGDLMVSFMLRRLIGQDYSETSFIWCQNPNKNANEKANIFYGCGGRIDGSSTETRSNVIGVVISGTKFSRPGDRPVDGLPEVA